MPVLHAAILVASNGEIIASTFTGERGNLFLRCGESAELLKTTMARCKTLSTFEDVSIVVDGQLLDARVKHVDSLRCFFVSTFFPQPMNVLTDRQKEILSMMCDCKTIGEIAESLNISISTVQSHLGAARKTSGKTTTYGLIAWYSKVV